MKNFQQVEKKDKTAGSYYSSAAKTEKKEPKDDEAAFQITVEPSQLTNVEMIWSIALEAEEPKVMNNAIAFLVNCYLSVEASIDDKRVAIAQSINARCFELIASS